MPRKKSEEPSVQIGFRLPLSLVNAVDAEIGRIAPPGLSLTRTDAIRVLLTEALSAREKARQKK